MGKPAFWDASALVPACVRQEATPRAEANLRLHAPVVWWGSYVEVRSAIARLRRTGLIDDQGALKAIVSLDRIRSIWKAILPGDSLLDEACRLLDVYPLRAAGSLQLAAALTWCRQRPDGKTFICSDKRLDEAAGLEGFSVIAL